MPAVSGLWIYPIKSCRGIQVPSARVTPDGLAWDRHWMVIDAEGRFLTQRQHPRMALVEASLTPDTLRIAAPGMPAISVPLDMEGPRREVVVWRDGCDALDTGEEAAQWFSEYLGLDARLVAFDESSQRLSDPEFAGDSGASTQFADGFSLLVIGDASLVALNERLAEQSVDAVTMARFRPNLTVSGLDAFDEDHVRELRTASGVGFRLVKPCARCLITTIDPASGIRDTAGEPLATLNGFRVDRDFGTVFGQNAIVSRGAGTMVSRGDEIIVEWNF